MFAICIQRGHSSLEAKRCALATDGIIAITALVVGILGFLSVIQLPLAASVSITASGSVVILVDLLVIATLLKRKVPSNKVEPPIIEYDSEEDTTVNRLKVVSKNLGEGDISYAKIEADYIRSEPKRSQAFTMITFAEFEYSRSTQMLKEIRDPCCRTLCYLYFYILDPSISHLRNAEEIAKEVMNSRHQEKIQTILADLRLGKEVYFSFYDFWGDALV